MPTDKVELFRRAMDVAVGTAKCRKCGCLKETLSAIHNSLKSVSGQGNRKIAGEVKARLAMLEKTEYSCLGCENCLAAEVDALFAQAYPKIQRRMQPCSTPQTAETGWPPVSGEYFNLCGGRPCPVAVSTLGSVGLAQELAGRKSKGLCIVGKTETENIGIDKIVKNIVSNPDIKYLVLCGKDPLGHASGKTLMALSKKGVDKNMKVMGAPSGRAYLANVSSEEIESFRKQVQIVDMIGCEDVESIVEKIKELSDSKICCSNGCCGGTT